MQDIGQTDAVLAALEEGQDDAIGRLLEFLRIPSISTDPAYASEVRRAGEWLRDELAALGFEVRLWDTPGHPMLVAKSAAGDARKLLFYGHYDVQPADPLELWDTPPFEPVLQETAAGTVIRGRGAADDKGQLMTFVETCRAWKQVHGSLPSDLILLFEGEEESGSPSLQPFLREHRAELDASLGLICDTSMYSDGRPAITTQLRGLVGEEVVITAADRDLHSGSFGGLAANPIFILTQALAALKEPDGRVTLAGFYDGVEDLGKTLAADWAALNFNAGEFLSRVGLSLPIGEKGRTDLEKVWNRPTAEINGINGGYTGDGFKTVLPATARAKVSFRLSGQQDPEKIRAAFRTHVRGFVPADCRVEFHGHSASAASVMNTSDPAFVLAKDALSEEWGLKAAFIGAGGSIPIAGHFKEILGLDTMLIGFGRDDDRLHSPNEKYDLESFTKGARSWARILAAIR